MRQRGGMIAAGFRPVGVKRGKLRGGVRDVCRREFFESLRCLLEATRLSRKDPHALTSDRCRQSALDAEFADRKNQPRLLCDQRKSGLKVSAIFKMSEQRALQFMKCSR